MQPVFEITGEHLGLDEVHHLVRTQHILSLGSTCISRIREGRSFLDQALHAEGKTYYGINTGFGSLYNVHISADAIEKLQHNLIHSHAAGAGPLVPYEIARLVLLLKIISFCPGNSGVRPELVEKLIDIYNSGGAPVMYQFGSLGASGDLAPLAHLALVLSGEGDVILSDGSIEASAAYLAKHKIDKITLQAKEGLALINGTQFSLAYAIHAVGNAQQLYQLANLDAACSLDGYNCNLEPFDARIHAVRPHTGQVLTAREINALLADSEIAHEKNKHLQDPYAFRCIPQVHGATWNAIAHCREIVEIELNSVTDNPLIFPESKGILSGGNFHGQPIALAMDYLAIALAELGSISERRTYQLVSGHRGLPDYLTLEAGIQSGFMIAQYTAASIVNRNKMLCGPASVDSIPSSKGQEDHVSMSANAASKLYELCENVHTILAIEFLVAMQALEFRKPLKTSSRLEVLRHEFRKEVGLYEDDRPLQQLIHATRNFLLRTSR